MGCLRSGATLQPRPRGHPSSWDAGQIRPSPDQFSSIARQMFGRFWPANSPQVWPIPGQHWPIPGMFFPNSSKLCSMQGRWWSKGPDLLMLVELVRKGEISTPPVARESLRSRARPPAAGCACRPHALCSRRLLHLPPRGASLRRGRLVPEGAPTSGVARRSDTPATLRSVGPSSIAAGARGSMLGSLIGARAPP